MKTESQKKGRIWIIAILCAVISMLPAFTECCYSVSAPELGMMTQDYNLPVGDELVLNCTLKSHNLKLQQTDALTYVNSTYIVFYKDNKILSHYAHTVDSLTSQLRIPNAQVKDSGSYYCKLAALDLKEVFVCLSEVNVGFAPKPVKNFQCVSFYYKNLTCTWELEENKVFTNYTLKKYYIYSKSDLQECPIKSKTYCQWSVNTVPRFEPSERNFTFVLFGNNSLGSNKWTFTIKHDEIFFPNYPQKLTATSISKQEIVLTWSPPAKMENVIGNPSLKYEMRVEELAGVESTIQVFDVGIDVFTYTLSNLIPYMKYNISLRCRSQFAKLPNDMWSPISSIRAQTLPDIPYYIPEISPEAFELRYYNKYRTVILYWKPVPAKLFNGEGFEYHVTCSCNDSIFGNFDTQIESVNVTSLSYTFDNLTEDAVYVFQLYSMNEMGFSKNYSTVVLDVQANIPELPQDITAISYDLGHYELTWKLPVSKKQIVDYVIFWCSSLKPWISRCEGPINWINVPLNINSMTLNLSDSSTNFQFAVASRTALASSGMKWATCIVPYKAALSKISDVYVEPKNATSLKVIWHLNCEAQKAVVKKYEIMYCEAHRKQQCAGSKKSVEVTESSAVSYTLQDLLPYTNYSIIVRAYNLADVPSEDSDPKFQATKEGTPSDPPQDVKVVSAPNATLQVFWKPPKHPNGVISHYIIHYNNKRENVHQLKQPHRFELSNLQHYVNYSVRIQACVNEYLCSYESEAIIVTTDIGSPGKMDAPHAENLNSTLMKLSWVKPNEPNGPIDFYEILWMEDTNTSESFDVGNEFSKVVSSELFTEIELTCPGFPDGGVKYLFSIRAINIKDGSSLYGPVSLTSTGTACYPDRGVAMIVGAAIGSTLALSVMLLLIYKLIKWMNDKIHQVKSIKVRLPMGLEGPENNPLNSYENFKKGLKPSSTATAAHLSYIVEEGDSKNRHGSGSSQYSYSSTEELLYRNGKLTKFVRMSSGESSGCGSLSSNVTKSHASSDSSTESDFMIPPSPDIVFSDHCNRRSVLPIVPEDKDSVILEDITKEVYAVPTVSPVGQPFSKFGISGYDHTMLPWQTNSVGFRCANLSNSEPSIKDATEDTGVITPYSKFGLAKSNGQFGLTEALDVGYSRVGIMPNDDTVIVQSVTVPHNNYSFFNEVTFPKFTDFVKPSILKKQDLPKMAKVCDESLLKSATSVSTEAPHKEDNSSARFVKALMPVDSGYVPFKDVSSFVKPSYFAPPVQVAEGDLSNTLYIPTDFKTLKDDVIPQKYLEFNSDSVAVIFDTTARNTSPILDTQCLSMNGDCNELCVSALPDDFTPAGYGGDFSNFTHRFNGTDVPVNPSCTVGVDDVFNLQIPFAFDPSENESDEDCAELPKISQNNNFSLPGTNPAAVAVPSGYIPLSCLSRISDGTVDSLQFSVNDINKNVLPNSQNCNQSVAEDESNEERTKNGKLSNYKVYPVTSDIPKRGFCDSSCSANHEGVNGKSSMAFHFTPEFCEV